MSIIALSACATWVLIKNDNYLLASALFLILIGFAFNLLRYFNNINQWIAFFLMGIENEDTSLKIPQKTGSKVIDEVFIGLNRLNDIFKNTKIEISTQEQYFKSVINQSATGLFSINPKGRIMNINPAAEKLTGLHQHHHINSLSGIDDALPAFIFHNAPNEQASQSAIFENKKGQKILFKLSEIITKDSRIKLVAVSDITKELDNREIDAWIKLARTLSHEIMNNIAPITTLSQVISGYFTQNNTIVDAATLDQNIINNTVKGLNVIEERSSGLMKFVDNYRKFTKLPEPEIKLAKVSDLIDKNLMICSGFLFFNKVKILKSYTSDLKINTDENLLSQVFVNIIKNAFEAMESDENCTDPTLQIKLCTDERLCLQISNNGEPIPPEIREQIFVPFYTTKETGSGIGLSLSKQIMLKMGGDIILKNDTKGNTCFWLFI